MPMPFKVTVYFGYYNGCILQFNIYRYSLCRHNKSIFLAPIILFIATLLLSASITVMALNCFPLCTLPILTVTVAPSAAEVAGFVVTVAVPPTTSVTVIAYLVLVYPRHIHLYL